MNPAAADRRSHQQTIASHGVDPMRPTIQPSLVAVDLGAESCRISFLRWLDGHPEILLVHRFANGPIEENGSLRWNLGKICDGIEFGLRACAEIAPNGIDAIGVDGWAVDYVRLDGRGCPVTSPFCYRDPRTIAAQKSVDACISRERLYALTGIQTLPLNTLYQLQADGPERVRQSAPWVNLPEYVLYSLGGRRVAEYTNATHTQLLGVENQDWCDEILAAGNLSRAAAPPVVPPGTDVGRIEGVLAKLPAYRDARLIAPACHDTASAIAGIPLDGNDWAFISSGTWSLVGCVLDSPCLTEGAMRANFSNEGGIGGKVNFLKNVNGMWLLQQCLQEWRSRGRPWTLGRLLESCEDLPAPGFSLNVDEPDLLLPGDMPARINSQLADAGHAPIDDDASMANLILHSLAARYASIVSDLGRITGRQLRRICVVGGGSRNRPLNRLTEKATGLEVIAGAVESATVGNFAVQLAALAGDRNTNIGVSSAAVSKWARLLASAPTVLSEPHLARIDHNVT
jgi:rhamnulokinase